MSQSRVQLSVRYTPPGGPLIAPQFIVAGEHVSQSVGVIDIPDATSAEETYAVPFGSVDEASLLLIQNTNNQEIGIRFGEAVADEFTLAPGGILLLSQASVSAETPLEAVTITTTATQDGDGQVGYFVFGDAATPP